MPRHTEKPPRNIGNKMLTRAAAAAAAASVSSDDHPPACPSSSSSTVPTTPTDSCPPRPEPPSSPAKCAICLGDLANRCYTNSCIHQFCFGCLLEWSKIKAECPLCKSNFQSIYHNIRTNDDYDEYHIPPPASSIPHLSIRLSADGYRTLSNGQISIPVPSSYRFAEPILPPHAHSHFHRPGPIAPNSPFHDHGYSFQRMVRERERSERQNQNSYIRILEVGPVSEPSALDFMNYSSGSGRQSMDNPFYEEESELFGSINENANVAATDPSLRGYTNRKRIYDRGQYVSPFQGTLMAGTVFFPSMEYFRTHPSSFSRVKAWLYREIMVLMGIHRSRTDMGYVFDVILGLLLRYDIRAREFRDMISVYMGPRTRHFQHEFYHFLLSGMHMEEYDRVARYTNPAPNVTSTTTTTTASSSVSTSSSTVTTAPTSSTSRTHSAATGTTRSETPSASSAIAVVTITDSSSDSSDTDTDGSVEHLEFDLTSDLQSSRRPPPVVPPPPGEEVPDPPISPVGFANLSRIYRDRANDFRTELDQLMRREDLGLGGHRPPTIGGSRLATSRGLTPEPPRNDMSWPWPTTGIQPPPAHRNVLPTSSASSARRTTLDLDGWESTISNLSRYRPVRTGVPLSDMFNDHMTNLNALSQRIRDQEARLNELPILDLDRPRCPVETGYPVATNFVEPTATRPERSRRRPFQMTYIYGPEARISLDAPNRPGPGSPGYVRRVSSHADPVTNMNPDGTPRRSTEPEIPPGGPWNIDVTKKFCTENSKNLPAAPPRLEDQTVEVDDEIEMLGIHPVVKPPPLAVITLSSDDEDGHPKKSKPKVEKQEPIAGTSSSTSRAALPMITDEVIDLGEEKSSDASLSSSLPSAPQNDDEWELPTGFESVEHGIRFTLRRKRDHMDRGSKRGKKKAKYVKSQEFLKSSSDDSSDDTSSSSDSDSDFYVEEIVDRKTKRKQQKEKKKSRCSKQSNAGSEATGSSHKSCSGKKKKSHHRKYKKCPPPPSLSTHPKVKGSSQGFSGGIFVHTPAATSSSATVASISKHATLSDSDSSAWDEPSTYSKSKPTTLGLSLPSSSGYPGRAAETSSFAGSSTIPGIGILDLRKLMEERKDKESKNAKTTSATLLRPNLARWESDEDLEVNGNEMNRSESGNIDHEVDINSHDDSSSSSSSSSSGTRFHSRETGEDRGRQGSFFIPPLTVNRSGMREPTLGDFFGSPVSTTSGGLLDFPLTEHPMDSPPWRFTQEPVIESAELLDLSIGAMIHDYDDETLNQRQSTEDGDGSGTDFYPSSNENAWLGDY